MDILNAIEAFGSLSQETRLRAFRKLVEYGNRGCPAVALSEELGVPQNTLSFHLAHLSKAELVSSRREGRSIIYSVNFPKVHALMRYMVENCCTADSVTCHTSADGTKEIFEIISCQNEDCC